MSRTPRMPAALTGGILVLVAVLIVVLKLANHSPRDTAEKPDTKPPTKLQPDADQADSDEKAARDLVAELSNLRGQQQPIPNDLRIKAEELINSKRTPYKLRIQLALRALDEKWAAKHIQIIFRNEISKRPFETITDLYRLVPAGELQQQVAESIFQTASITSSDAPGAVAFLESIPPDARKRVISIIGSRLSETKDLGTMRMLEKSSHSEELKNGFQWWVAEMEKESETN